jgi:hypothetical protein
MRTRLLVGVALAAALAGAGGVRAAPAAVGFAPVAVGFTGTVPVETLPSYGARGMHVVGYEHGGTTRLRLTLENTGPLPLTVEEVALPGNVAPLLTATGVTGLPLRLGPGATGAVELTAVLGNCRFSHEREVETRESVRLRFRVLGASSTREVLLDRPILVHSPMIVGCPDRKLDRQADNRVDLTRAS